MNETKDTKIPNVYLSDLENLVARIKKNTDDKNVEVSFEFIIASLFPTSWNNIQSALADQYIRGYKDGHKDGAEETRLSFGGFTEDADCFCD